MLFPAPYEVLEKKTKKKAMGTRKGLQRKVVSDTTSEDTKAHSSNEDKEEEEEIPPPTRGEKKRKAAPQGEAEASKKGKTFLSDHSTTTTYNGEEWLPKDKPLAKS